MLMERRHPTADARQHLDLRRRGIDAVSLRSGYIEMCLGLPQHTRTHFLHTHTHTHLRMPLDIHAISWVKTPNKPRNSGVLEAISPPPFQWQGTTKTPDTASIEQNHTDIEVVSTSMVIPQAGFNSTAFPRKN